MSFYLFESLTELVLHALSTSIYLVSQCFSCSLFDTRCASQDKQENTRGRKRKTKILLPELISQDRTVLVQGEGWARGRGVTLRQLL